MGEMKFCDEILRRWHTIMLISVVLGAVVIVEWCLTVAALYYRVPISPSVVWMMLVESAIAMVLGLVASCRAPGSWQAAPLAERQYVKWTLAVNYLSFIPTLALCGVALLHS